MTKTVTRHKLLGPGWEGNSYANYTEMREDASGEWVRYDDIKHLLADEPPHDRISRLREPPHCSTCECWELDGAPAEPNKAVQAGAKDSQVFTHEPSGEQSPVYFVSPCPCVVASTPLETKLIVDKNCEQHHHLLSSTPRSASAESIAAQIEAGSDGPGWHHK